MKFSRMVLFIKYFYSKGLGNIGGGVERLKSRRVREFFVKVMFSNMGSYFY